MHELMRGMFRATSIIQANYVTQELTLQADTAWIFGTYMWLMRPVPSGTPVTDQGDYLAKWVYGADRAWRIQRSISNSWDVIEADSSVGR